MGIGDRIGGITSNVVTRYKVDVSDAKRKTKELTGAQKKAAQEQIAALEKQNKGIDSQIVMLGKAAAAVGALALAYKGLQAAAKVALEEERLLAGAREMDLAGLRKVTRGLVSDTQLLEFASTAFGSSMKPTNEQMKQMAHWALELRVGGGKLEDTLKGVGKAMMGDVEAMSQFGLNVEGISKGMQGFDWAIKEAMKSQGKFTEIVGDDMRKAMVSAEDASKKLAVAIGQIGLALEPVTRWMASLVSNLAGFLNLVMKGTQLSGIAEKQAKAQSALDLARTGIGTRGRYRMFGGYKVSAEEAEQQRLINIAKAEADLAAVNKEHEVATRQQHIKLTMPKIPVPTVGAGAGAGAGAGRPMELPLTPAEQAALFTRQMQQTGVTGAPIGFGAGVEAPVPPTAMEGFMGTAAISPGPGAVTAAARGVGVGTQDASKDFMRTQRNALIESSAAYGVFQNSATSAFAAVIEGSASVGEALEKMTGNILAGTAVELFAESLKHSVLALGALASTDFKGAAIHGKAAGMAAIGAATLGGLARMWNSDKSVPAGQAPALGGGGGALPGEASVNRTIIIGSDFEELDPRKRASRLREIIDRADAQGSDSPVVYS
jgi:hypothetical protein